MTKNTNKTNIQLSELTDKQNWFDAASLVRLCSQQSN